MNYFNYFTEIETRFQQRRGSILMLSALDWALIETWREAGIPLEAVLLGIDSAFDKHEGQRARLGARRQRKVNGLAWCAQAVMEAVERAREAAIGAAAPASEPRESGFEHARIARFLKRNAAQLDTAAAKLAPPADSAAAETATRLRALETEIDLSFRSGFGVPGELAGWGEVAEESAPPSNLANLANLEPQALNLEDLDRTLTVLEEKLVAALLTATPEDTLVALREQAARELAPYRSRMQAVQIKQVQQQFLHKRLLESNSIPRLSLFYMPHEDAET